MPDTSTPIYQLKITLLGIRPSIWRRLQVPGDFTLNQLHRALQAALGWTDSHLHLFQIGDLCYKLPDPDFGLEAEERNERGKRLNKVVPDVNTRFRYDYDYGDNWQHEILVEKIFPSDPGETYPVCLIGERACPPEDCGGVEGYQELLRILRNPRHPEYPVMRLWAGERYDPEAFDIESVNRTLRKMARPLHASQASVLPIVTPELSGASYTQRQGQFLAFIHYYTQLNRRPPAEADMQAYFRVSPPSIHQMVITLEQRGLITRVPGQVRSIRLLLPPDALPDLEGNPPREFPASFAQSYPHIALWVQKHGYIELGYDYNTDSCARSLDDGGLVWSGGRRGETQDEWLQAMETGIAQAMHNLGLR